MKATTGATRARATSSGAIRAGIYARISDDRTGEKDGVTRQRKDCEQLAKRQGWAITATYIENDTSAFSGVPRPEYQRMMADLASGTINAIIAWHPDRLHRSPRELEDFIDAVERAKAAVVTVRAGEYDMNTANGRQNARIVGSVARGESERMRERIVRKHEQLAAEGRISGGGTRPYGFQKDRITIVPDEAERIRKAADDALAGRPIRAIARDWQLAGVRSPKSTRNPVGTVFGPNAVRRILRSGRIAGLREHHGEIAGRAVWPAIIDATTSRRLRSLFDDPARLSRRAGRSFLLSGFLRCGRCGAILKSWRRSDRTDGASTPSYLCKAGPGAKGCGGLGIVAGTLEKYVADAVFEIVDGRGLAAAVREDHKDEDEAALRSISEDEQQLADLADDFAAKRITRPEWLRVRDAVQARLDSARGQLARQNGTTALAPYADRLLRVAWPAMDLDERRAVLAAVIDTITIGPAKKKGAPADRLGHRTFDVDRVAIDWRY